MTATATRQQSREPAAPAQGGTLAGVGTLVRFILRRDRIKLPAWLLGSTFLLFYFHDFVTERTANEEDIRRFMEGTVGALFGPGYGRDDITAERYLTNVYGVFFFVLAALMSMLLVARHTRMEEQSGRSELVRSNVVGRHAQLTATLAVAAGANVVLALLLAGGLVAQGHDAGQGLLFGAGVAAVGLVFAGITALTVQVTEYSRTATSLAGAVLGAAWAVRAVGDMLGDHGSPLSWFSPLAWSNQTRVYVDGRWWPLLLSAGLAVVTAALGYALSGRRDVGAGLVAARSGVSEAAPWLASPLAAAFRLQRSALFWWTAALAAFGFVFGVVTDQVADPDDISQDRLEMFGGSVDALADGYLGVITLFIVVLSGVMVVLGVQSVWAEENKGRAEPILATATSRTAWFGGHLAVIAAGLVGLLLVAGFAAGLGAAIALGDGSYVLKVIAAHLAHVPGVLVLLGIAALLFGVLPRAIGVVWAVLGYSLFAGLFGTVTDMPQAARNLMPMEHVGQPPLDDVSWTATIVLLLVAAALSAAGLAGFRRRDLKGR